MAFCAVCLACGALPEPLAGEARGEADRLERAQRAVATRAAALETLLATEGGERQSGERLSDERLSGERLSGERLLDERKLDERKLGERLLGERLLMEPERESWRGELARAGQQLEAAAAEYRDEVLPRLQRNRAREESALRTHLRAVRERRAVALAASLTTARRAALIAETLAHGEEQLFSLGRELEAFESGLRVLEADVGRAASRHPAKRDDLARRFGEVAARYRRALPARASAEQASRAMRAGEPVAASLAAGLALLEVALEAGRAEEHALRARISELDRSRSQTLINMRERWRVLVYRRSWRSEVPGETHEFAYACDVDARLLDALRAWGDAPVARPEPVPPRDMLPPSDVDAGQPIWAALCADRGLALPRRDDAAAYTWGAPRPLYEHRYLVFNGDRSWETPWVKVDEQLYVSHAENLGMDLVAKPYGRYEDEELVLPAPPGLAAVGSEIYGRFREESDGLERWWWSPSYEAYGALFDTGEGSVEARPRFEKRAWERWQRLDRGVRPYYGAKGEYGSSGRHTLASVQLRRRSAGSAGRPR